MFWKRSISLALVSLFLSVTACSSTRQIGLDQVADYNRVRVITTDGSVNDLHDPRVQSDSISGRIRRDSEVKQFIALDQVSSLEVGGNSEAGLAAVFVLGILGVAIAVAASEWDLGS